MPKVKTFIRILKDKDFRFYVLSLKTSIWNKIPDEEFLRKLYKIKMGKNLDLNNPSTYTEKIQWLKLYDRRDIYTCMVDKYEAKKFVAQRIGEQYVIPTLGVWDRFDDICFDDLPEQFVLKCTHDSGGLVICRNKSNFDVRAARKKINRSLKRNYYWTGREWPYKNVKPRIIAEEYMEDSETNELRDYKLFTFGGVTKALFIATERQVEGEETKFDFFNENGEHLPIINGHMNATVTPKMPINYEKMKELAYILAKDVPHLRVDFYEVNGKIYFGELTFSHWSGLVPFEPSEWDDIFGEWLVLPR